MHSAIPKLHYVAHVVSGTRDLNPTGYGSGSLIGPSRTLTCSPAASNALRSAQNQKGRAERHPAHRHWRGGLGSVFVHWVREVLYRLSIAFATRSPSKRFQPLGYWHARHIPDSFTATCFDRPSSLWVFKTGGGARHPLGHYMQIPSPLASITACIRLTANEVACPSTPRQQTCYLLSLTR